MPAQPVVVVGVLTYRRPQGLARLLPLLVAELDGCGAVARVLVVDNDPGAGAREAVGAWSAHPVAYVHEPRPGIAAARNRALAEALAGGADAIVFIDDDEWPSPGWLRSLLRVWDGTGAAAVTGPVVSRFAVEPDPWVRASGVFDRRRLTTGTRLHGAATNNLLLDLAVLDRLHLRFDEGYGTTGGEDTRLTHELVRRGEQIVWCDEAEVVEPVAPERLTRRWVLRRQFRAGNSWTRVEVALAGTPLRRWRTRVDLTVRGCANIGLGLAQSGAGRLTGDPRRQARGLGQVVSYAGLLSGVPGHVAAEYARPPGHVAAEDARPTGHVAATDRAPAPVPAPGTGR